MNKFVYDREFLCQCMFTGALAPFGMENIRIQSIGLEDGSGWKLIVCGINHRTNGRVKLFVDIKQQRVTLLD